MIHPTWLKRASHYLSLMIALLATALLVGCGASKKYGEFIPTRILSIGDAMSYIDFSSGAPVNTLAAVDPATGIADHWLLTYAGAYGLTSVGSGSALSTTGKNVLFFNNDTTSITPASGAARDALGRYDQVKAQTDHLPAPQDGDLVVMSMGMGDIFDLADNYNAGSIDEAKRIGLKYANLADSIYQRGYKHVLIVNAVDFSSSPYVAVTKGEPYRSNVADLTKALNDAANINCNGGCSAGDDRPYHSRAEGVWKFNLYVLALNITQNNAASLQANINSIPLCDTGLQTCSLNATPASTFNPLYTSLYDAYNRPYFYSNDLFTSPVLHRYFGSLIYNYSRSFSGF